MLVKSITSLLTDLRTEGIVLILKIVELVFKTFPTEGPELFKQLLPEFLKAVLEKDVSAGMSTYIFMSQPLKLGVGAYRFASVCPYVCP